MKTLFSLRLTRPSFYDKIEFQVEAIRIINVIKIIRFKEIFFCDNIRNIFFTQSIGCSFDRLTVHANTSAILSYCGNEPFSVESTGKIMIIELSTTFWSSRVRFLCELQAVEEIDQNDGCRCGWKNSVYI